MKAVWLVTWSQDYGEGNLVGVYATKAAAVEATLDYVVVPERYAYKRVSGVFWKRGRRGHREYVRATRHLVRG